MWKKNHKLISILAAMLVFLLGTSSCSKDSATLVYEYHAVPIQGWNKTDTVVFTLPDVLKEGQYQIKVGVRTNARFPYANVWLGVCQTLEQPDTVILDTVCCAVSAESGITKEGIGLFLTESQLPGQYYHLGQKGCVKVFHILQKEEIPGVLQVGLQIQTARRP